MDYSKEQNELMKIIMDPNAPEAAKEAATNRMQELSNNMVQQSMAGPEIPMQGNNAGFMSERNNLMQIMMDPNTPDEARERAAMRLQELSMEMMQQMMSQMGKF